MAAIWMSVSLGFLPAFGFGTLRNGKAFSRAEFEDLLVDAEVRWYNFHDKNLR